MAFPYSETKPLVNTVVAETIVSIQLGVQVAQVNIVNAAGELGQITLSPLQPKAVDIELKSGLQVVLIDSIVFKAAFALENGSINIAGKATDQDGKNEAPFVKKIASWPNS